jgi:hypothetical protein
VRAEPHGGHILLIADDKLVSVSQTAGPELSFRLEEMPWSPAYGQVVTAHVLRATLQIDGPVTWALRFRLADGVQG